MPSGGTELGSGPPTGPNCVAFVLAVFGFPACLNADAGMNGFRPLEEFSFQMTSSHGSEPSRRESMKQCTVPCFVLNQGSKNQGATVLLFIGLLVIELGWWVESGYGVSSIIYNL